jgi:MFS family permease
MPKFSKTRKIALLVGGPMLVETTVMILWAWMIFSATKVLDKDPHQQMWISSAGAVGYCFSAFIAGRWVTPRVAPWLMGSMLIAAATFGLIGIASERFEIYILMNLLMGLSIGHYYVPFQINMGHIRPFRTLAYSVAFYNVAWGLGGSIGPYLTGTLRDAQIDLIVLVTIIAVLVSIHVILIVVCRTDGDVDPNPTAAFTSTVRQRRAAWASFFAVGLVFRGLYATLWPDLGKQLGWTDWQIGLGQTLMLLPVAAMALVWARFRHRLVDPWWMLTAMVIGAVALSLLPMAPTWSTAVACGVVVGIAESCVVYHSLYYSNADTQTKGRSLGIAEMLAGSGFLFGPLIMGTLAWDSAQGFLPYGSGSVLILAVATWFLIERLRHGPYQVPSSDR